MLEPPCGIYTLNQDQRQPPRLRLVPPEPDLDFEPDEPPEMRALPPPAVRHVAIVEVDLIRAVASLFAADAIGAEAV